MNPLYPAPFLFSINVALASILTLATSFVPSGPANASIAVSHPGSQLLGGWPEHLPWRFPVSTGLDLEINSCTDYALPSSHDAIQQDLNSIIHTIETEGDPAEAINPDRNRYLHGLVLLWVYPPPPDRSRNGISRKDMIKVLKAIEYIFVYTDLARSFDARVMLGRVKVAQLYLVLKRPRTAR